MSNQNSAAYTNEMDPTQSGAQPTQPYTTQQTTTTTTHTSRGTDRAPTTTGTYVTAPGATTGERVSSGEGLMGKMKGAAAAVHGTGEALRGAFNTGVDNMAGDKVGASKERATQEKGLGEIRERSFHPTTTSGMTGQGSMGGTGGLTGTGAGGVVGHEAKVPAGSSGDVRNAPQHDGSLGRGI